MKIISIDRSKRLREEPHTGHNRWHPDIVPVLEVNQGEDVVLETRDASDGQINLRSTASDLASLDTKVAHPLTGPVYIKDTQPGDILEIEYVDIIPQSYGHTHFTPERGFLRDFFNESYLVHWDISDGWATSHELPGVRIPNGSFMGTAGVAPSHTQLGDWTRREAEFIALGGIASPPDPEDAIPAIEPIASEGLRTIPPRENGGNADIKQLTKGSKLLIPVSVEGALYSVGDGHFAQGDSECCITAIEIGATAIVRFNVLKKGTHNLNMRFPRFSHQGYFTSPEWAVPSNFTATIGLPIREDGTQAGEDLTLAAKNALLNMIDLLQERGWSRSQAYIICSVCVDLKISNAVDLPNVTVSALLPEDIFEN